MTPKKARELLTRMEPKPTCSLCGMVNPPTRGMRNAHGEVLPIHDGCEGEWNLFMPTVEPSTLELLDEMECRDALETIIATGEANR